MALLQLAPPLKSHIRRYAESHSHPVNRALHFVGIPLLMTSALGFLSKAIGRKTLPSWLVGAGAAAWYETWDRRMAVPLGVMFGACDAIGQRLSVPELGVLLAAGASLHDIGHYHFEHKPPAFFTRPVAVLEAPAWLLASGEERLESRLAALAKPS
jgi:uncharacterized membrane protein YGL010W